MSRTLLSVFLLTSLLLLWACSLSSAQPVHALWGFTADGPFSGTPEQTVTALRYNAINAVFADKMEVALLQKLKAAGLRVFATIQVFGDHSVWKTHPQLRPINSSGVPVPARYGSGFCPTQRWYWPAIIRRVSQKLSAGYDGVWLDFIRFGGLWEQPNPQLEQLCFCDSTLADFSKITGIAIPDSVWQADSLSMHDSLHISAGADSVLAKQRATARKAEWILTNHRNEWTHYKTGVITEFVRQAKAVVAKKPGARLGVFTVPWRRNEYGDAIVQRIGQDYKALAEHVDVISPMLYHELCGRPVEWISGFVKYAARLTSKPVWPIIQSELGEEHRLSDEEFAAAVLTALDPPSQGLIVFRQQPLLDAKQLPVLRAAWQ
jgi:hypothetical protein